MVYTDSHQMFVVHITCPKFFFLKIRELHAPRKQYFFFSGPDLWRLGIETSECNSSPPPQSVNGGVGDQVIRSVWLLTFFKTVFFPSSKLGLWRQTNECHDCWEYDTCTWRSTKIREMFGLKSQIFRGSKGTGCFNVLKQLPPPPPSRILQNA